MVVEYLELGRGSGQAPYVNGIFVSADNDDIEKTLRSFEPALHDFWWPKKVSEEKDFKEDYGLDSKVAFHVRDGIDAALAKFKDALRPPEVRGRTILKDFGHVLGRLLKQPGGSTTGGGKAEPIQIHFKEGPAPSPTASGGNQFRTVVDFTVDPGLKTPTGELAIFWSYVMVADEDSNGDELRCSLKVIDPPKGFDLDNFRGILRAGQTIRVEATSEEVPAGISVRARPSATITPIKEKGE
jgi:hypothetical protein